MRWHFYKPQRLKRVLLTLGRSIEFRKLDCILWTEQRSFIFFFMRSLYQEMIGNFSWCVCICTSLKEKLLQISMNGIKIFGKILNALDSLMMCCHQFSAN